MSKKTPAPPPDPTPDPTSPDAVPETVQPEDNPPDKYIAVPLTGVVMTDLAAINNAANQGYRFTAAITDGRAFFVLMDNY